MRIACQNNPVVENLNKGPYGIAGDICVRVAPIPRKHFIADMTCTHSDMPGITYSEIDMPDNQIIFINNLKMIKRN